MTIEALPGLPLAVLNALPNPVLVKDEETRYVWVNGAFERLFDVRCDELVGRLDTELFQERQAAQCNGGDLRVLASGEIDEAEETVIDPELGPRETLTRKSRLTVDGRRFLVGVMHDVTDVVTANQQLSEAGRVLEEQAEALRRMASTDPLTGCLNRRALFEQAEAILGSGVGPIGLVVFDLDNFKSINDTYGHAGGDAVLTHFAATLAESVRSDDLVARLGGEEFAIVLPGAAEAHPRQLAERVRLAVERSTVEYAGQALRCTVSVGVIHAPAGHSYSLDQLVATADRSLYEAKDRGRNQVVEAPRGTP